MAKIKNQVEMDMAVGFYDSRITHADKGEWGAVHCGFYQGPTVKSGRKGSLF